MIETILTFAAGVFTALYLKEKGVFDCLGDDANGQPQNVHAKESPAESAEGDSGSAPTYD